MGEPRLSFGYLFVGHPWKALKLYTTVHSYLFFSLHTVLYCFHWKHKQLEGVLSVHGGSLSYEGIGQIQNVYVILKGENLGFHLDINLSASLENILSYTQPYIHIYFSLHTVLYCFHWEHRQLEEVLRAHGGSLRYEWIGHIQNVYVILKGEKLGFQLDINSLASLENF